MSVVAVIPARGGSKSIPLKNIKEFCGKPMIVHSIEAALAVKSIDRVIVSTDCPQIAEVSKQAGAEVPFVRPDELSLDDTPDLPVFIHCLKWMEKNEGSIPEVIVHLRPTSPLRTNEMIEEGIRLLLKYPEADSVRSVCSPSQNPFKMWQLDSHGFLTPLVETGIVEQWNQPRQKLPSVLWQNGYVDVTRSKTILEKKSMTGEKIYPLVVNNQHVIDIDDQLTLELAEIMYERDVLGE